MNQDIIRKNLSRVYYHGTTTVGLVCKDGVVLATDTRVTQGGFVAHKRGRKLIKIDSNIALTISGGVADAQNVVDILRYHANLYRIENKRLMPVKSAAMIISNVMFSSRLFPFIADVLVGGFDQHGPSIYSVDFFGSVTSEKMTATGSGSPVAFGVLESEYKEGMPVSEGYKLAAKAVIAAMRRNIATGDGFDVAIIDSNGYREISDKEKEEILQSFNQN